MRPPVISDGEQDVGTLGISGGQGCAECEDDEERADHDEMKNE